MEIHCLYYGYRHYKPSMGQWLEKDPISPEMDHYRFCGGNSLAYVDAWGMYQANVHFYATYQMAISAGLSEEDARELAYYAEYPDEVDELDAIHQGKVGWPFWASETEANWMHRTQMSFHQLNGQPVVYETSHVRDCLRKIFCDSNTPWEKGFALHALGDSYSHIVLTRHAERPKKLKHLRRWLGRGRFGMYIRKKKKIVYGSGQYMYSSGLGHLADWTAPDIVSNRPNLAMAYLRDAYALISGGNTVDVDASLLNRWTVPNDAAPTFESINPPPSSITQEQIIQWMEKLENCLREQ